MKKQPSFSSSYTEGDKKYATPFSKIMATPHFWVHYGGAALIPLGYYILGSAAISVVGIAVFFGTSAWFMKKKRELSFEVENESKDKGKK